MLPYAPLDQDLGLLVVYCSSFDLLHNPPNTTILPQTTRDEIKDSILAKILDSVEPIFAILGTKPVVEMSKMDVDV